MASREVLPVHENAACGCELIRRPSGHTINSIETIQVITCFMPAYTTRRWPCMHDAGLDIPDYLVLYMQGVLII